MPMPWKSDTSAACRIPRLLAAAAALAVCCGCGERESAPRATAGAAANAPQATLEPIAAPPPPARPDRAGYVGSESCRECHDRFYELWSTSRHAKAMRAFDPALLPEEHRRGSPPIEAEQRLFQAVLGEGAAAVEERGPDGATLRYPIAYVMGDKNVLFFLTELDRGRLQVLPVAFDLHRNAWYHTAGSMLRSHLPGPRDEPLGWRARAFTWNASCLNCHVSQLDKNYDAASDSYSSTWLETGVNCEVCHGPCAEHNRAMRALPEGAAAEALHLVRPQLFTPEQSDSACAACHAKLRVVTERFQQGDRYFDHYGLATLEDPDFFPDGRDYGENFTYTQFLMSPCVDAGALQCVHCHTSSGRMKQKPPRQNDACAPCHQELVDASAAHSHHEPGSDGDLCVTCHMPETAFARMKRHDHTLLPPAPAATLRFQSPNACNICHDDKDAAWADEWVRRWYPRDYQAPLLARGELVAAARRGDWARLSEMLRFIADAGRNQVFRTSLIRLLGTNEPSDEKWDAILAVSGDTSPLVRTAVAEVLGGCPRPAAAQALVKMARTDSYRTVRFTAAFSLSGLLPLLPGSGRQEAERAFAECVQILDDLPDSPAAAAHKGTLYQNTGELELATAAFETALRIEPEYTPALVNLSVVSARLGRLTRAEELLRTAAQVDPRSAEVQFNLGLLYAEIGRTGLAEAALRAALAQDPAFAQAAYNLAVLVAQRGALDEAVELCRRAAEAPPRDPRYAYTLAFYQRESGRADEAIATLEALVARAPDTVDAWLLLGAIHEQLEQPQAAAAVYRRAQAHVRDPQAQRLLAAKLGEAGPASP